MTKARANQSENIPIEELIASINSQKEYKSLPLAQKRRIIEHLNKDLQEECPESMLDTVGIDALKKRGQLTGKRVKSAANDDAPMKRLKQQRSTSRNNDNDDDDDTVANDEGGFPGFTVVGTAVTASSSTSSSVADQRKSVLSTKVDELLHYWIPKTTLLAAEDCDFCIAQLDSVIERLRSLIEK
eukprot:gene28105-33937_t